MKKFTYSVIAVLLCANIYAQNFWQSYPYLNMTPEKAVGPFSFVSVNGGLNFGTDAVNNAFLSKLYRGGHMDSLFVENAAAQLLPVNRFGVHTEAGITFGMTLKDSLRSILTFSLQKRSNISGKFSDDAFRLGFQGNSQYRGEEADISGTRFTSMSWTQLKFTYQSMQSPKSVLSFGFSVIAGNRYNEANVHYGKLFTDSQGLFIDGSVYGEYYSSDTSKQSPFAVNGFGTSVDITWTYYGKTDENTSESFRLDVLDFGFINWNDKTIRRYVDTTFHYEGVDVTPLFTDPNYVVELPSDDDFIKTDTTETHRSIFLPGIVRATYTRSFFGRKLSVKALAAVPVWSYALPYGSITFQYKIPKIKTAVSTGVAYGGYSRLQVPFKIVFYAINKFSLDAETTNLLVFFKPDELAGCGAFVKLTYCF